jgi:sugar phosphate permease
MAPLAGAFGGLLASAILTLDSFGSLRRWRMIFAIEGIITCLLSLIAFFTLTDRPETARWLNQEEKDLAIARVKSERVGQNEVLDKLDKKKTIRGILNPVVMATSFIFLLDNITVQGLAFFAPTIVRTIYPKNTVVSQQLHTVPPYIVGAFFTVLIPFISWRIDRRTILFICSAPLMMVGYIMVRHSRSAALDTVLTLNSSLPAKKPWYAMVPHSSLHQAPSPSAHFATLTHPPMSYLIQHALPQSAQSSCSAILEVSSRRGVFCRLMGRITRSATA